MVPPQAITEADLFDLDLIIEYQTAVLSLQFSRILLKPSLKLGFAVTCNGSKGIVINASYYYKCDDFYGGMSNLEMRVCSQQQD